MVLVDFSQWMCLGPAACVGKPLAVLGKFQTNESEPPGSRGTDNRTQNDNCVPRSGSRLEVRARL